MVYVRKFVGIVLMAILGIVTGYQYAWHKDFLDNLDGIAFFGAIVVFLAALFVLLKYHHWYTKLPAFVVGIVAFWWGALSIDNISWTGFGLIVAFMAVFVLIWMILPGTDGMLANSRVWAGNLTGSARRNTNVNWRSSTP